MKHLYPILASFSFVSISEANTVEPPFNLALNPPLIQDVAPMSTDIKMVEKFGIGPLILDSQPNDIPGLQPSLSYLDPDDPTGPLPPPFDEKKVIPNPISPSVIALATALSTLWMVRRRKAA